MNTSSRIVACCAFLCLASIVACGDDDPEPIDASVDALADAPPDAPERTMFDASFPGAPPPSPDGLGWCCVAATPSCACGVLGAFVTDPGTCPLFGVCDSPPADHHLQIDEHGCEYYTVPIVPTVCDCLCVPTYDAGVSEYDAGVSEYDAGSADDGG